MTMDEPVESLDPCPSVDPVKDNGDLARAERFSAELCAELTEKPADDEEFGEDSDGNSTTTSRHRPAAAATIARPVSILKSPSSNSLNSPTAAANFAATTPTSSAIPAFGTSTTASSPTGSKRVRFAKKIERCYWFMPEPASQHWGPGGARGIGGHPAIGHHDAVGTGAAALALLALLMTLMLAGMAMAASYCRARPELCAAYWPESAVQLARSLRLIG